MDNKGNLKSFSIRIVEPANRRMRKKNYFYSEKIIKSKLGSSTESVSDKGSEHELRSFEWTLTPDYKLSIIYNRMTRDVNMNLSKR